MDKRLEKEVKRLGGDEKYFAKYTTDEEVYKVLGVLEVADTWEEFKKLRERRYLNPMLRASYSMPEPDGFDKVLTDLFKKGKPKK